MIAASRAAFEQIRQPARYPDGRKTVYDDFGTWHKYQVVYRLFAIIGMFPWTEKPLQIERRFREVMARKHPKIDWDEVILGIRTNES
jgi:hypothetical protein